MSFYIILDTLDELVKLTRLRLEYEAQNNLLLILFTGYLHVILGKQERYCH